MVARVAVWAAGKVGGRNPVPSEPQGAHRSSAALAEVFFSYCEPGRNVTDLKRKRMGPTRIKSGKEHAVQGPRVLIRLNARSAPRFEMLHVSRVSAFGRR